MNDNSEFWNLNCTDLQFEQCRRDPKFAYLVALARALNALNTADSLLNLDSTSGSPEGFRTLTNSFFLSSASLYEIMALIRKMNKFFKDHAVFQNGLKMLLNDPVARKIEQMHLNPARNHAVFHFLPDKFEKAIMNEPAHECAFAAGEGDARGKVHYTYADIVTGEMMIGVPAHREDFFDVLKVAAREVTILSDRFVTASEELIYTHLRDWGFTMN